MSVSTKDETRTLAQFAAQLQYADLPAHVRVHASDILVDQLGCQIGCAHLPWAQQVYAMHLRSPGSAEATLTRYGDRVSLETATFVNSVFGHSFEFDDANPLVLGHIGAELIPPLLAVAERAHLSGSAFLAAFVAGYEVRGHVGWALTPDIIERGGPQVSTVSGPFGAAAGVAKLLGLNAEQIRHAIGIAGGYSGGLMQYDLGGGSVKRVYSAIAASGGLKAGLLAQAGITGPEGILEGGHGVLKLYATTYRPERLVAELGDQWTIAHTMFKPYSCCAIIHPAIDALTGLMATHALRAEDIERIDVGYPASYLHHCSITAPKDLLGMQFSTSYSLALTLLRGGNTPRQYEAAALTDADIAAFAARVHVREDQALTSQVKGNFPARVRVQMRSGAVHDALVRDSKGSPGAPMSSAEIDDKFRSQVTDVLGVERCQQLLGRLRTLDTLGDIADLMPLLVQAR